MARSAARALCGLALCAGLLGTGRAADPIPTDTICSGGQFLDMSALQCTSCPDRQEPHPLGFSCVCAGQYTAADVSTDSDTNAHCTECGSLLVPPRAAIFATRVSDAPACLACTASLASMLSPPPALPPPSPPSIAPSPPSLADNSTACVSADGVLVSALDDALVREGTLGFCTTSALAQADERCSAADDESPECGCPAGMVVADTNSHGAPLSAKVCEPCAPNAYPDASDSSRCVPCDDARMVWTEEDGCRCPDGWSEVSHAHGLWGREKTCVHNGAKNHLEKDKGISVESGKRIRYEFLDVGTGTSNPVEIDSATLQQLFVPAATECRLEVLAKHPVEPSGRSACQALANLCVLVDYDDNHPSCKYYQALQSDLSGLVHDETEWKPGMPWLYYKESVAALTDTTLDLNVAVAPDASARGGGDSRLRFVLNSYTLNGTWLGLTNLTTELQLCGGSAKEGTTFADVGTHYTSGCELDVDAELASLFAEISGIHRPDESFAARARSSRRNVPGVHAGLRGGFHELYIRDRDDKLFPVPVRLYNFPGQVNVIPEGTPWGTLPSAADLSTRGVRLTRRFFLVDALSGREDGAEEGEGPKYVRYAADLTMGVKVQELDPSSIYPPVLAVRYAEAIASADTAGEEASTADAGGGDEGGGAGTARVTVQFKAVYTMELTQYWQTLTMLIVFACVLVFFIFIFSSYIYMRRNQKIILDGEFVCHSIMLLLRAYADVFLWLIVGLCAHWYIFFKGQASSFIMLPAEESTGPIVVMLVLCLAAKAVHVLSIVMQQSRADVFLIDWEGSHGTLLNKGDDAAEPAPVSTWRAIFAANELNELQARRFTSPALSLVLLLLLLEGANLNFYAKAMPGGAERSGARVESHVLLRFAVSSFAWAVVLLGQQLLLRVLWLPYVEDKVGQFVDLLSVANISAFILPEPQAGYYLHGRSVHAHADTSMLELNRQLRAEEDGVTSGRGLSTASDVQTFEVFLTRGLRELYDQTFLHAAVSAQAGASVGGGLNGTGVGRRGARGAANPTNIPLRGLTIERARRAGDGFRANPEAAVQRYVEMNNLLKDFIDNIGHHEYQIREKTYSERLFGLPPDMYYARDSLFLYDPVSSWTKSLLYGREYDLAIFEVLVFSVADVSIRSSFMSAAITYLVSIVLCAIRSSLGQSNMAKKTLIDDRFLI